VFKSWYKIGSMCENTKHTHPQVLVKICGSDEHTTPHISVKRWTGNIWGMRWWLIYSQISAHRLYLREEISLIPIWWRDYTEFKSTAHSLQDKLKSWVCSKVCGWFLSAVLETWESSSTINKVLPWKAPADDAYTVCSQLKFYSKLVLDALLLQIMVWWNHSKLKGEVLVCEEHHQ
jgi:hypothetical protein